jgi:hypothetical protein
VTQAFGVIHVLISSKTTNFVSSRAFATTASISD